MSLIDVTVGGSKPGEPEKSGTSRSVAPFLGVRYVCASGVYGRLYRNPQCTAYEGRCPVCMKPVSIRIGSGGVSSRFFSYDCHRY